MRRAAPAWERASAWLPLAPVLVATALVSAIIVTLGAPLVPVQQEQFGITEEQAQWSYTITLLAAAAFTPIFGRLADGPRRRSVIILVCGLVSLGCAISSLAWSFPVMLVGRALQGLAVSLVAMAIAAARADLAPGRVRSTVALLSITTALGAGISYPVSTVIADRWGMAAAFACAAAAAALAGLAAAVRLPPSPDEPPTRPDVLGALLLATGVGSLLVAVTHGNEWGWASAPVLALTAAGALILVCWTVWELRIDRPLIRLQLLADRRLTAADVAAVFMGMCLYSVPVLVSRLAQLPQSSGYGAGLSLAAAGAVMIPIAVGNLVGSRVTVWGERLGGARFSLMLGSALAIAGVAVIGLVPITAASLVVAMSLIAVGAGATFGAMPALVLAAVAGEETGSAMSFNLLLRTVGGTVGSALTAAALGAHLSPEGDYPEWAGFQLALAVCAAACAGAFLTSAALLRSPRSGWLVD